MGSNILHLVLKSNWFDKIKSGEKIKEYREVKPYWDKRLGYPKNEQYKFVKFRKGYKKDAETMTFEIKLIGQEHGLPNDLGQEQVWVIYLGENLALDKKLC